MAEHDKRDSELRRSAEARVDSSDDPLPESPTEIRRVVHELRVQQAELEMQNESLRSAELELEAARDRYFDLFEMAPIPYLTLDAGGNIVEANLRLAIMLGVERANLAGRKFSQYLVARSADDFHVFRMRVQQSGTRQTVDVCLQTENGAVIPARLQSLARAGSRGGERNSRLAVLDLSEVEGALTRLKESNSELEAARLQAFEARKLALNYLELADEIMVALDTRGRITMINRKGCDLLGCREEQVLGKDWFTEFLPEDMRDGMRTMFRESVEGNRALPEIFTNQVVTKQGMRCTIRWHNLALRDFAGRIDGALSSGTDITEQLRLEHKLQKSNTDLVSAKHELYMAENMMTAVVENAVDAIVTIDTNGIIQTVNQATLQMFGYDKDELVGKNVSILMPSPDREQHDGYIASYLSTGIARIIGKGRELTAVRKNGERFPAHLSVSDIRDHTKRLFTGILRDQTHEHQLQRQLKEQEALATIGSMAAVVAHEVKNPLAGISGVIQVLRGRLPEDSAERPILNEVLTRIDALVETLEDLLFYARPRELKLSEVRLADLLGETVRLLAADPRSKNVTVELPESKCRLKVDVDYLREALLNVYLNAAQAMDGKGKIRTEMHDESGFCMVKVIDEGPGIPEEIRTKVFEPFFTTKGKGTGLGLALVKRVIESHGGRIDIDCPSGGGTIVTLALPDKP